MNTALKKFMVLIALVLIALVAIFAYKAAMRDDQPAPNPDAVRKERIEKQVSAYIAKTPTLKGVELLGVTVENGDAKAEISATDGKIYCRMDVNEPNKLVRINHLLAVQADKRSAAETLEAINKGGIGCLQVATMAGIGDGGKLSQ